MTRHPYEIDIKAVKDGVRVRVVETATTQGFFVVLDEGMARRALQDFLEAARILWPDFERDEAAPLDPASL